MWRKQTNRGGGRGGYRQWTKLRKPSVPIDVPPVGRVIELIKRHDLIAAMDATGEECRISECQLVATYNWIGGKEPKMMIPGKPPLWTPPAGTQRLSGDDPNGTYYRDHDAAMCPTHTIDPAATAVMTTKTASTTALDIVACASTLGNLLRFVQGETRQFRMLVEVIGGVVHFIRRENSPTETIADVKGYGYAFPEAYTTWEADVKGSTSHQRIIQYQLGGLNILSRHEADAYLGNGKPAHCSSDDIVNGLQNAQIHREKSVASTAPLQVVKGGSVIPQDTTIDIKTRSNMRVEDNIMAEQIPRFWLRQVQRLVLAFHNRGVFDDVSVRAIRDDMAKWETENQSTIQRLVALIRLISDKVTAHDKHKFELVYYGEDAEQGRLAITEQLPDAGKPLSEKVRREWIEWLGGTPESAVNTFEKDDPLAGTDGGDAVLGDSDSESEDFTACGANCGYCGRCKM